MKIWTISYLFFNVLLATELSADSAAPSSILDDPIARYTKENLEVDQLSFWSEEIVMQIAGQVSPDTAFYSASLAKILADNAGSDLRMMGDPDTWFLSQNSLSGGSNLILIFQNLETENREVKDTLFPQDIDVDFTNSALQVRRAVGNGLKMSRPGCYGNWSTSSSNVIEATVQVIDVNLSNDEQKRCANTLMHASFGVAPTFTTLTFSDIPGIDSDKVFVDSTEPTLLLRMLTFCREELNTTTIQCPKDILENLYMVHAKRLANQ